MTTEISFKRPHDVQELGSHIRYAASLGLPMVQRDKHKGASCVIVSTAPSLNTKAVLSKIKKLYKRGTTVFALKEAIPLLEDKGIKVTYSCSMDPGGARQVSRTPARKGVTYCVASSCNPMLFDHLLANECEVNVFHSACGHQESAYERGILMQASPSEYATVEGEFLLKTFDGFEFSPLVPLLRSEVDVYQEFFDNADVMQGGYTVTNRCLALAKYMGFSSVTLAGTDFGWRVKGGSNYVNSVDVEVLDPNYMTDHGAIDGKEWYTKPDQLASAVDVARKIKAGDVKVIGDSLAVALSKHDEAFLAEVVRIKEET